MTVKIQSEEVFYHEEEGNVHKITQISNLEE